MFKSMLAEVSEGRYRRVVQGEEPTPPQGKRERRRRQMRILKGVTPSSQLHTEGGSTLDLLTQVKKDLQQL